MTKSHPDPNMPRHQRKLVDIMQNFKEKLNSLDDYTEVTDEMIKVSDSFRRKDQKPNRRPVISPAASKTPKGKGKC